MTRDDETLTGRRVRRWYWVAGVTGVIAAVLFIAAILTEVGKLAGVGGVLLGVAVVVAALTAVYADVHNL